jgi:hypothetical protein
MIDTRKLSGNVAGFLGALQAETMMKFSNLNILRAAAADICRLGIEDS